MRKVPVVEGSRASVIFSTIMLRPVAFTSSSAIVTVSAVVVLTGKVTVVLPLAYVPVAVGVRYRFVAFYQFIICYLLQG